MEYDLDLSNYFNILFADNSWFGLVFFVLENMYHHEPSIRTFFHMFHSVSTYFNAHSSNTWLALGLCAIGATGHLVPSKDQLADGFTKALPTRSFKEFRRNLNLV